MSWVGNGNRMEWNGIFRASVRSNIRAIRELLGDLGIKIQTGNDLGDFAKIIAKQPLRHDLSPAFDPRYSCAPHRSAYWMAGYTKDGELACTQAVKLIDLGDKNLEQYLRRRMWDLHPYGYDPDVTETHCFLSDESRNISGLITYHGELWLKGGPDGVRGGSIAVLTTRLILLESLLRWSPDFLIGLQSPMTACRGLSVRESYMRLEQRSLVWYKDGSDELLEGWLVWMTAEEADFNLRIPAELFYRMFERGEKTLKASVA